MVSKGREVINEQSANLRCKIITIHVYESINVH